MRVVSISFNLVLIAWVTPAQLGLLAVVRALCFFVDYASGQSVAAALVRRTKEPEREEYASLAGLQLVLLALILVTVLVFPQPFLRLASLDPSWSGWVQLLVATMLIVPFGSGARVRLERNFDYRRLAVIEVSTVLLQNVGLIAFALFGRFEVGVFAVTYATTLYGFGALYLASPGPTPKFAFSGFRRVTQRSGSFTLGAGLGVAQNQLTVVLISHLLGLQVAGFWAFATRFGQLLQMGFEGFRRAVIPAAAQLSGDLTGLRRLSTSTMTGAALVTLPLAGVLVVTLPLLPAIWPQWASAIGVAQLFVLCMAVAGVAGASLEPVGVATRGPATAFVEPLVGILCGWTALWVLHGVGSAAIGWAIGPMYLAPALVLYIRTNPAVRPEWSPKLRTLTLSLLTGLACFAVARLFRLPAPASAILACIGMIMWLVPLVRRGDIAAALGALRG
jgi:O-antigen/teichoic acid export membrane protein